MKKFTKYDIILTLAIIALFLLFRNNLFVKENIVLAVNLWLTKVLPSLFPMFILSDILIYSKLPERLSKLFGTVFSKIFKTSKLGIFVFIISLLSGTPSNAYLLKELITKGRMSKEEGNKILAFSFFSNPLFLYTMLSLIFPNNMYTIFKIILIHYGCNILIGLTIRNKNTSITMNYPEVKQDESFGIFLSKSIQKAMNTMMMILGTITFFLLLKGLVVNNNINVINTVLSGFLELTQGLNALIPLNIASSYKELLAIAFISFGGLSIHMQIKNLISEVNLSYFSFLKGRLLHVIYSIILVLIF